MTNAQWKRRNLKNVTYQLTLYETDSRNVIWQGDIERLAGFFGGMPDNAKALAVIQKHLQEANIIQ